MKFKPALRSREHSGASISAWVKRPTPTMSLVPLAALTLLSGCSTLETLFNPPPPALLPQPLFASPDLRDDAAADTLGAQARTERPTQLSSPPPVPRADRTTTVKPETQTLRGKEVADISLAFDQQPLPNFIQLVYGQVLKKNFSLDPTLLARTDLVTLRTGVPQTPSQVQDTARMLLKSYGVAVQEMGDFVRIVPDSNQSAYLPEIRRGRAQPDVPLPLRPVFQLVELSAVRNTDVSNWLKAMFGARITIQDDPGRNALLLSGQSAEVLAALEAIQVLDQPLVRSRSSQLITPGALGVEDLAKRLVEILTAEGYGVGTGAAAGLPISLVPIAASNALLVFATDPAVLKHVIDWSTKLDSLENGNRRGGSYFSYEVKYADAQGLAKTLQELMSAQASTAQESSQLAPGMRVIGASVAKQATRIVVNAATNTLIVYTGNPDEYAQLLSLMKTLDKPSKSALIEVTVAEVRVGDKAQLGVEWSLAPPANGEAGVVGGTLGGLGLGSGGLSLSYINSAGLVRAKLNALASQNRARILSSPRVMARNGEAATIQVGQEVPIITSQQSNSTGVGVGGINTGVLQTIQYRPTGVILRVKPIIFAGRVELDVQQEVSSASATVTGVSTSPTFSTRKVDTKVSIRDGATVALGGLISRTEGKGDAGIPLLKDIPVLGQLFRTNTQDLDETELIILITPYVVENDLVAEQVTQAFKGQLGSWAQSISGPALPMKPVVRAAVGTEVLPTLNGQATPQPQDVQPVTPQTIEGAGRPVSQGVSAPLNQGKVESALPRLSAGELTTNSSPTPGGTVISDPAVLEELRRLQADEKLPPAKTSTSKTNEKSTVKPAKPP